MPANVPVIDSAIAMQFGFGRIAEEDENAALNSLKEIVRKKMPHVAFLDSFPDSAWCVIFQVDDDSKYIVKIRDGLKDKNGLLLFTPGKSPVFCSPESLLMSCNDSTLLSCYFGK